MGGGITSKSIWVLNGPNCGKALSGTSVGIGVEGGFGGYVTGSPTGTVGISPKGTYNVTGGAGIGAGSAEYVQRCKTRVISCENTPQRCKCKD